MPIDSSSSILITGGTGSFGKAFISEVLQRFPISEELLFTAGMNSSSGSFSRFFQCSISPTSLFLVMCDQDRLRRALEQVDTVVHAAALKQVPAAEYIRWNCKNECTWC